MDPDPGSLITMDPNSASNIVINTDKNECGFIDLKKGKVKSVTVYVERQNPCSDLILP
jgi:hypothetical protein